MSSKSSNLDIRQESLAAKRKVIESNPCYSEQTKSIKCLELKDSDECQREFDNYLMCKTFWYEIQKFRKLNDIYPSLPEPEERDRMKRIYMKNGSLKPVIEEMKKQYNL